MKSKGPKYLSLTPKVALDALSLVRKGKIYSLSRLLEIGIPLGAHGEFFYSNTWTYDVVRRRLPSKNELGFLSCRLEMPDHTGTHLDALNHISIGDKLYGNVSARSVLAVSGTDKLGIDTIPPIVCRGIMVDVASYKRTKMLPSGYVITRHDIEATLKRQRVSMERSSAIFFNTGWERLWMVDNKKFINSEPGIGMEAAEWLDANGVPIVGSDNHAVEVKPFEDRNSFWPVHQFMVTKKGILVIENMKLNQLVEDEVYEFLFICSPLPLKGGSGSPVAPLAIV